MKKTKKYRQEVAKVNCGINKKSHVSTLMTERDVLQAQAKKDIAQLAAMCNEVVKLRIALRQALDVGQRYAAGPFFDAFKEDIAEIEKLTK